MMCDFGTGNNNKMNWVLEDKQELIDIVCSLAPHDCLSCLKVKREMLRGVELTVYVTRLKLSTKAQGREEV